MSKKAEKTARELCKKLIAKAKETFKIELMYILEQFTDIENQLKIKNARLK